MRILANENVPADAVDLLRRRGHDVFWVHTDASGSSDEGILSRAESEQRLLVTFDKNFGELAFGKGRQASSTRALRRSEGRLGERTGLTGGLRGLKDTDGRMLPLEAIQTFLASICGVGSNHELRLD